MKRLGVLLLTVVLIVIAALPAMAELETKTVTVTCADLMKELGAACDHKPIDVTLASSGLRIQSPDTICTNSYYTFYTNYIGSKSEVVFQAPTGWSIQKIEFGCQEGSYLPSAKEGDVKVTSSAAKEATGLWTAPSDAGLSTVTFVSSKGSFSFLSSIDKVHNVVVTLVRDSAPDTGDTTHIFLPCAMMFVSAACIVLIARKYRKY